MSAPRVIGAVALLGLTGLLDCGPLPESSPGTWRTYPCGERVTVCDATGEETVRDQMWSFEDECVGASCGVHGEGPVSIGDSFHPADRALYLGRDSVAELPFVSRGTPDGARLSLNVRCTDGAQLWFEGDGTSSSPETFLVASTSPWRRFERRARAASSFHMTLTEALEGSTRFTLRLHVTGAGECVVDRVRYTLTALVCARSRTYQPICEEWTPSSADSAVDARGDDAASDLAASDAPLRMDAKD